MGRLTATAGTVALSASGTMTLAALWLPEGFPVQHLVCATGTTAASTPTHMWMVLCDSSRVMLAQTADQTTSAWAVNTERLLAISATAEGSASSFVTRYTGLYYVGIVVTATGTMPTLFGAIIAGAGNAGETSFLATPVLGYYSTASLTTPSTFPTTFSSSTGTVNVPWVAAYAA
jgi:hypothetical protein